MKSPRLPNEQLKCSQKITEENEEKLQIETISEDDTGNLSDNTRYTSRLKKDLKNFVLNTPKASLHANKTNQKDKFSNCKGLRQDPRKLKVSFNRDKEAENNEKGEYLDTFDKNAKENKPVKPDTNHFAEYIQKAEKKFKVESLNKHIDMINKGLQKSKNVLTYQRKKFIDNMKSAKREKSKLPNDINRILKDERIATIMSKELLDSQLKTTVSKEPSRTRISLLKASFKGQSEQIDPVAEEIEKIKAPKGLHRYRRSNEIPTNILKLDMTLPKDDSYKAPYVPVHKEHEFCNVFKIINFLDQDTDLNKQRLAIREKMKLMKLKASIPPIERYSDEKAFLGDYEVLESLGEGSYAKVKLIKDKKTEELYALKIYKRCYLTDELRRQNLNQEISLLASLEHPGVVSFIKAVEAKNHIYIIMEFVSKVSLHDFIEAQGGRLSEAVTKRVFYQLVKAVEYLHGKSIVHRDLKLQNILLQNIDKVKVIDFGFACEDQKLRVFCGTPSYMAPEIVKKIPYKGKAADIWALGVILYKMLTGMFPFKASTESELYSKISKIKYNALSVDSKLGADLLRNIFMTDPSKRLKARDILKHKWFYEEKSTEMSLGCDTSKNI